MWKETRRICFKLAALILPFFIVLPLYCRCFPYRYMDGEYAMYRQQYDYVMGSASSDEQPSVLIIGDSRAKAAFDPARLEDGASFYNLSLGGTTPIEGYYTLKNYLLCHEAPETVVICYAPMHYMDVDTLWTRAVYFHTFSQEDFEDMTAQAVRFEDTENVLIEHYRLEYWMYRLYLPNKYATALKKSLFTGRRQVNLQKYAEMEALKGHTFYGTAEYSDGVDGEAKVDDFQDSDMIVWYLQRMIDLGRENDIRIIVEQAPVNETSYRIFTQEFKTHFRAFMGELAQRNPDIPVFADFYCYPNDCFGDADHLNLHGVEVFCGQMREKYGW